MIGMNAAKMTTSVLLMLLAAVEIAYSQYADVSPVTGTANTGVQMIVGYWFNAGNNTISVVDITGKLFVFGTSTVRGIPNQQYAETLVLPANPSLVGSQQVLAAVTGGSGDILIYLTDGYSYRYFNGGIVAGSQNQISNAPLIYSDSTQILGLGAYVGIANNFALSALGLSGGKLSNLTTFFSGAQVVSRHYYTRYSANAATNELLLVARSKFLHYLTVTTTGFVSNTTGTVQYQDTTAYYISSNIGSTSQYLCYARFRPQNATGYFQQDLVAFAKPNGAQSSIIIEHFFVYSVAFVPNLNNLIFVLSTLGDLYSVAYTGTAMVITLTGAPILVSAGAAGKYFEMATFTNSLLSFTSMGSMSIFDPITNTLAYTISIKPEASRDIRRTPQIFLIYHNFNITLWTAVSNSYAGWSLSGKIREVVVNYNVSFPRFYVLTDSDVKVFDMGSKALVASKTYAAIGALITGSFIVKSISDIDILINNPNTLAVLCYCTNGVQASTFVLFLNEFNLLKIDQFSFSQFTAPAWPMNAAATALATFPDFSGLPTIADVIICTYLNTVYLFKYASNNHSFTQPNILGGPPIGFNPSIDPYQSPAPIVLGQMVIVQIPGYTKTLAQVISTAPTTYYLSQSSGLFVTQLTNTNPGPIGKQMTAPIVPYQQMKWTSSDSIRGNITSISKVNTLMSAMNYIGIWSVVPSVNFNNYIALNLPYGIPYQNSDDSIYISGGTDFAYQLNPALYLEANAKTATVVRGTILTTVTNCDQALFLNPGVCMTCLPTYFVSSGGTVCRANCNPQYAYNGNCVTTCPIEQLNDATSASAYICISPAACTGASKVVFGDRCASSCLTGTVANASGYCLPTDPTTALQYSLTPNFFALSPNPCPTPWLWWNHFQQCTDPLTLPTTRYSMNATDIFCDTYTHFYDIASKQCLQTCTLLQGTSTTMGKYCANIATCIGTLQSYTALNRIPNACTSTCNSSEWTNLINNSCDNPSCLAGYSLIDNRTCVSTCGPNYLLYAANSSCLTIPECLIIGSGYSYILAPSYLCAIGCPAGYYLDEGTRQCLAALVCVITNITAYNVGGGYLSYYDSICLPSCRSNQYLLESSRKCLLDLECFNSTISGISSGGVLLLSNMSCMASCPKGFYYLPSSRTCLSAQQCKLLNTTGGLLEQTNFTCVSTCPTGEYLKSSTQECLTQQQCLHSTDDTYTFTSDGKCTSRTLSATALSTLVTSSTGSMGLLTSLIPLLMTALVNPQTGAILCIIAQSYDKLIIMSNFNFELQDNTFSRLYGMITQSYTDVQNNALTSFVFGKDVTDLNKQNVCDAKFNKLCQNGVDDGFLFAHFLDIMTIAITYGIYLAICTIFSLLNKNDWAHSLAKKLVTVLIFAWILDNNLAFWFTLTLNLFINNYSNGLISFVKIVTHMIMFFYTMGFVMFVVVRDISEENKPSISVVNFNEDEEKQIKTSPSLNSGDNDELSKKVEANKHPNLLINFYKVLKVKLKFIFLEELVKENCVSWYFKGFLIHDIALSVVTVVGNYAGMGQMFLWTFVEIALIGLIVKYKIYKNKWFFYRQLCIESLYAVLSLVMGLAGYIPDDNGLASALVFVLSLGILLVDLGFALTITGRETYQTISRWISGKRKKGLEMTSSGVSKVMPMKHFEVESNSPFAKDGIISTDEKKRTSPLTFQKYAVLAGGASPVKRNSQAPIQLLQPRGSLSPASKLGPQSIKLSNLMPMKRSSSNNSSDSNSQRSSNTFNEKNSTPKIL